MPFGLDTGISRETSNTVQTAQKADEVGVIDEMESFGGTETVTEEVFNRYHDDRDRDRAFLDREQRRLRS